MTQSERIIRPKLGGKAARKCLEGMRGASRRIKLPPHRHFLPIPATSATGWP